MRKADSESPGERGMSLVEVLITIAILATFVLLAAPLAQKIIRRSQTLTAFAGIRQTLASARLQAVKRVSNVVVQLTLAPDNRIRLQTFQDRANDEATPLPADEAAAAANFQQDTGSFATSPATDEPTLGEVTLGPGVRLWKSGGTRDDLTDGVSFDGYDGDASLTDRIAFLPTGGIAPPEDGSNSGLPTASGGRGIYFADPAGRNFFRVTIDSDLSGRLRIDKFVEGLGYAPTGWIWR